MRRRKAILLFGLIFLALAAYCTWCARPFYLKPSLTFDPNVTEDGRQQVLSWHAATGGFGPECFTIWSFVDYLKKPYRSGPTAVRARFDDNDTIYVYHPRKAFIVRFYYRADRGWDPPAYH